MFNPTLLKVVEDLFTSRKAKRLQIKELIIAIRRADPLNADCAQTRVCEILEELERQGKTHLPGGYYEELEESRMEDWNNRSISYYQPKKTKAQIDFSLFHPQLYFASRVATETNIAELEALDRWFKADGHVKAKAFYEKYGIYPPLRERSLEIFGDEKYLVAKLSGGSEYLYHGRYLNIKEHLYTQIVGVPIANYPIARNKGTGRNIVIENHTTAFSIAILSENGYFPYETVWYGAGNALGSEARAHLPPNAELFLDIDDTSTRLACKLMQEGFVLATDLYHALLDQQKYACKVAKPTKETKALSTKCAQAFPKELVGRINELFAKDLWLPQEALGLEALIKYAEQNSQTVQKQPTAATTSTQITISKRLSLSQALREFFGFLS